MVKHTELVKVEVRLPNKLRSGRQLPLVMQDCFMGLVEAAANREGVTDERTGINYL